MTQAAELEELDQQPNARLDDNLDSISGIWPGAETGIIICKYFNKIREGQAGQTARNVQLWRCVSF